MHKQDVLNVITKMLAHDLTVREAVDQIDALYNPPTVSKLNAGEYMHWVVCTAKGLVHVYHASECADGEDCELFKYLSKEGSYKRHKLQRGYEYDVTKDADGKFVFESTGTTKNKQKIAKPKQTSLLDK